MMFTDSHASPYGSDTSLAYLFVCDCMVIFRTGASKTRMESTVSDEGCRVDYPVVGQNASPIRECIMLVTFS
jgi:hypothetical protein